MSLPLTDMPPHPDRISFASDVELLALDDEALVYSADMQALFSLNATAAFMWRVCETGQSLDEIISRSARKFRLPRADARHYVESAVAEWRRCGLLEGSPRIPAEHEAEPVHDSNAAAAQRIAEVGETLETRHYAVLDTTVTITCQTAAQAERVHAVVGHLEIAPDAGLHGARPPLTIDIVGADDAQKIFVDGQLAERCATPAEIAPLIHWLVFSSAVGDNGFGLQLHTAAVARDGHALLLPGPAGAGKSTLSSALLEEGFGYLSDDMVVLDCDSFLVRGLPFSICVKESGLTLLDRDNSAESSRQLHLRADGKRVHYRHPLAGSLVTDPQAAGWVMFPRYAPGAAGECRMITPAEALRRLLGLSAPPRHLSRDTAVALMAWAAGLRCCELDFSDTDFAVKTILDFCGKRP